MSGSAPAREQKADPPQKRAENRAHPVHAPPAPLNALASLGRIQLQSRHRVSSPADPAEREAEATAKKIVHMALPADAPPLPGRGSTGIQRRWIKNETPRVARKAQGPHGDASSLTAEISGSAGSGAPLPPAVRNFMEPRFQADFGNVRIHTGGGAAQLNRQLNAQAFALGNQIFFGKDKFKPDTHEGKELIAHELTHTIQQGAAVQRGSGPESGGVIHRSAEPRVAVRTAPRVQRLGIDDVVDYIADKANNIPGFRMLTVIIGRNPINKEKVERSGANILRAIIDFIPGGELINKALDQYGILDKAGKWLEAQFAKLVALGESIIKAFWEFIDSLGWRDALHPFRTWERAKRIFSEPIDRLIDFIKGLYDGFIAIIKAAILRPLAKLAEGTRGYDLLKAILKKDPVTGEPYPQTAETLIGGFMKLIHQEEVWENIKKANALPRAWAWFQGAIGGLLGFVGQIPTLFVNALKSLVLMDIILLPRAFMKVAGVFGSFFLKFVSWAGNTVWSLLEIIFEVVAPGAMPYLKKAAGALKTILKNPIGFVRNLVKAGKLGFQMFSDNIGTHLKNSLIEWLTGSLPGVYIPQALEFKEIVKFVLSVLGLTWQNIRQKLVKVLGETAVKAMETGFDIVVTLVRDGPAAAWEKIKEQLGNLQDMVMGAIVDFVVETVVKKAVAKVVSMLVPGGAFIQAIITIYDTIMVFIDKLQKIIQVAKAFLDSIMEIASGAISGAAKKVESTLAGLLTLAISFLAGFAGLGKIADKVMDIINTKVRGPIDKALDMVIGWIVSTAKALFAKLFGKKDERTDAQKSADLDKAIAEAEAIRARPDISESEIRKALPAIKRKYNMASLELVIDAQDAASETVHFLGSINPNKAGSAKKIPKGAKNTEPEHKTSSLGGDSVGVGMTVEWLGPGHLAGSPPADNAQTKLMGMLVTDPSERSPDKFVRGHLLNENLGGPGVAKNLFPITGNANSQHLRSTETDIKKWVNESGKWAFYDVKVEIGSYKLDPAKKKSPKNYVNSVFVCHYILKEATGEVKKDVSTSVPSTYEVKETAEKTDNLEDAA